MNIETFLKHHGLRENPFESEEARHDPVFERMLASSSMHPDFTKILGRIDRPSTSVVFGEKGSGKTAIRLLLGRKVCQHNSQQPQNRTLLVPHDDLNPVLDRLMHHRRHTFGPNLSDNAKIQKLLDEFRLQDHQDAILSLAVTRLIDAMLHDRPLEHADNEYPELSAGWDKKIKKIPRKQRADLVILAALYDQPHSGSPLSRWSKIQKKLRLRWQPQIPLAALLGFASVIVGTTLFVVRSVALQPPGVWLLPTASVFLGAAIVLWMLWAWKQLKVWSLVRQVRKEMPAIERSCRDLRAMVRQIPRSDLSGVPWPMPGLPGGGGQDSRYQLTGRLLTMLEALGYVGMMVLVDRVDEPTIVSGKPLRMRPLVWPMFDSKFLQQDRVGLKLLLPIELRHMLHRESAEFFQEARLDKQNLIDRLTWSGAMLYDLCSTRLRACRDDGVASPSDTSERGEDASDGGEVNASEAALMSLFDDDVTREMLIDALDQMRQPRDAFKFLYSVIQEHCRTVSQDMGQYQVQRLVLDAVRRSQSQRVQDLYQGLTPA